ncbi:MAG: SUF system NifU family Fe-S cluster assembly protein [Spirochaetaceae bacterium]|nr:SUF system NifU family Fe-S cluster assembly protein [Spirochaetaceae bacterium]
MGDLDDLYMEIILDHYKSPRNKADLSHIDNDNMHENPSCGDSLKLEILMGDDGRIDSVRFDGHGCAISTASASLMTERLPGKTPEEARSFIEVFLKVLRGEEPAERLEEWGDLAVLGGVVQFPMRVKCATLAWHALEKSLED